MTDPILIEMPTQLRTPRRLLRAPRAGDGAMVGAVGLHRPVWATPKFEVGYWARTRHAGRGYVSEGVAALTQLAFVQLQAARLELLTDEANAASRRVAERCGFTLEGTLRNERRAPDGTLRHTCVYACTVAPAAAANAYTGATSMGPSA